MIPSRGDKLYKVFNGTLETAIFIEESICEGATAPTWLVITEGRKVRCSVHSYCTTKKEAWEIYERYAKEALIFHIKLVAEYHQYTCFLVEQVFKAQQEIAHD